MSFTKFANLKTKQKILLGSAVPLVLLAGLGAISVSSLDSISQTNGWVNHTYDVLGDGVGCRFLGGGHGNRHARLSPRGSGRIPSAL